MIRFVSLAVTVCLMALPVSAQTLPKTEMEAVESPLAGMSREALHQEIRAYLLENPEVLVEAMQVLEARRQQAEASAAEEMLTARAGDIFEDGFSFEDGNPEGSVTVVEFLDYRCGFCKRAHTEVSQLLASDDDIRLIVKELPILGPDSTTASRFAIATGISQGAEAYKRIGDALMTYAGPMNDGALDRLAASAQIDAAASRAALADPEVDSRIAKTLDLARALQVNGTPTFVIGNRIVRGYIPLSEMRDVVAEAREAVN